MIEEIKKEIDNLTERQKTVFILKTYEELTYEEIANILKSRVGTIKATYFQSLQKIRENLKKKGVIKNEM
ncbi:MAG TPA: RNA polymerase sigma factor [bacterium]|nr:RNA polymerase sigma factor [bacterium]